ncbi:hypothetical protein D3C85_1212850 [compost metagenome]
MQDDEAVGRRVLQVAGNCQGLPAEGKGQVVEVLPGAVRQRQRRIGTDDVAGGRDFPRMARRPAQVRRLEGVGLGDTFVRSRREAPHHVHFAGSAEVRRERGLDADGGKKRGLQKPVAGGFAERGGSSHGYGLGFHCCNPRGWVPGLGTPLPRIVRAAATSLSWLSPTFLVAVASL